MGVRRAVEIALRAGANAPAPVFTWGELIHNHSVGERLVARGVRPAETAAPAELPAACTVIIRAHGVPPAVAEGLRTSGRTVLDATCPLVKNNQTIIEKAAAAGRFVIIAGDADHAETVGLLARATAGGAVLTMPADAAGRNFPAGAVLLAQTTFSQEVFIQLAQILKARIPDLEVCNTICAATAARQDEVAELAGRCPLVIIVGGAHSANTRRLAEVARHAGARVMAVETAAGLCRAEVETVAAVAVSAGASTPEWEISAVMNKLREWGGNGCENLPGGDNCLKN